MKNFLLLFLIGATCVINAQKLDKAFSKYDLNEKEIIFDDTKVFSKHHLTEDIDIIPDVKKNTKSDYSSSEAFKVGPGWISISDEQIKAGGGALSGTLFSVVMYPDTTVKKLLNSGDLNNVTLSGYGQTINFNNEALSAATDYQFITSRDTVNIDSLGFHHLYVRSKKMAATKSDSIIISYGVVPRNDIRANWIDDNLGYSATAKNPKATSYLFPKATGVPNKEGFQKVFTSTGISGFKTVAVALTNNGTEATVYSKIPVNTKLTNDSLFIYYVAYKPDEFAPANDTIFDWNNPTRDKYSSFRMLFRSENANDEVRYFDDQNLTTVSGVRNPVSYTTNFFQFADARYRLTVNNKKITYMSILNIYGALTDFYVSGNSTLSTNEKLAPKFVLAPNPANNTLSINFKEVGEKSIEIIDMVGRVIHQYAANNANSFSTNDISGLPNGFYFVKITNDLGISATKKLIISHH